MTTYLESPNITYARDSGEWCTNLV